MSQPRTPRLEIFGMLARWVLGGMFLYTGCVKAMHPVEFLKMIRQYDMVHSAPVLDSLAALLPWFEIACGLLLVLGVLVRGSALVLLAMLIPFTIAVFQRALTLKSTLGLTLCAIKFDCGCGTGEEFVCRKLVGNLVLIALSIWLVAGAGRKGSLAYGLFRKSGR